MKSILLILMTGLLSPLMAGSTHAEIEGKSASGRTGLRLLVENIEGDVGLVQLTIDGKTTTIKRADIKHQTVIRDREHGVYVISVASDERTFRLWMIPRSEKVLKSGHGLRQSRFSAVLEAEEGLKSGGYVRTPRITVECSLQWTL